MISPENMNRLRKAEPAVAVVFSGTVGGVIAKAIADATEGSDYRSVALAAASFGIGGSVRVIPFFWNIIADRLEIWSSRHVRSVERRHWAADRDAAIASLALQISCLQSSTTEWLGDERKNANDAIAQLRLRLVTYQRASFPEAPWEPASRDDPAIRAS